MWADPSWGRSSLTPRDLLNSALDLVEASSGRPRQANLRRAISATYYALFHCLAECGADLLVGKSKAARSEPAWERAYRALEHGAARGACTALAAMKSVPKPVEDFANRFVELQTKRHRADYSPAYRFYKRAVLKDIANASLVIAAFQRESAKQRRALVAYALFKPRN
jgi:hypothetical protein